MAFSDGLHDGLGGEKVMASGLQDTTQNAFFAGSFSAAGGFSTAGSLVAVGLVNTGGASNTGSLSAGGQGFVANVGSPYGCGLVVPMTARTIISGGQFVSASGGLAYTAPTSCLYPLGIATATAQSGATVNVLLNGIAPVIAEGTVAIGAPVVMGAGAGQNCVKPLVANVFVSGTRTFCPLDAASSGTTSTVFIQL